MTHTKSSSTSINRNCTRALFLVILQMKYRFASDQFANIQIPETDDQPRNTESTRDNRISLDRTTSSDSKVDDAYQHRYLTPSASYPKV